MCAHLSDRLDDWDLEERSLQSSRGPPCWHWGILVLVHEAHTDTINTRAIKVIIVLSRSFQDLSLSQKFSAFSPTSLHGFRGSVWVSGCTAEKESNCRQSRSSGVTSVLGPSGYWYGIFQQEQWNKIWIEGRKRERKGWKGWEAANSISTHVQSSLCELQTVSENIQTGEKERVVCAYVFNPSSF